MRLTAFIAFTVAIIALFATKPAIADTSLHLRAAVAFSDSLNQLGIYTLRGSHSGFETPETKSQLTALAEETNRLKRSAAAISSSIRSGRVSEARSTYREMYTGTFFRQLERAIAVVNGTQLRLDLRRSKHEVETTASNLESVLTQPEPAPWTRNFAATVLNDDYSIAVQSAERSVQSQIAQADSSCYQIRGQFVLNFGQTECKEVPICRRPRLFRCLSWGTTTSCTASAVVNCI